MLKKGLKKLLSQKSTQKRAFTSEVSQKRALKSEFLKKVNYFFEYSRKLFAQKNKIIFTFYSFQESND